MRKLSRQDFETIVGTLALAAAALGLWIVSTARFDQVDGLTTGNPVYLSGIQVGSVMKIDLAPNSLKALVTISVRSGLAIPADSALLVMSDGVLGGKYLRIEAASEMESLKPGARFETVQDSVIVEQILQKIVQGAEARRRGDDPKPEAPKKNEPPAPEKKPEAPEPPKQQ